MKNDYLKRVVLLILCFWSYSPRVFAITGNDWNRLSTNSQAFYVIGVIDGWKNASQMCKEGTYTEKHDTKSKVFNCEFFRLMTELFLSCFTNSPYDQLIAIVRKYMEDHPEDWHTPMAFISLKSFNDACRQLKP